MSTPPVSLLSTGSDEHARLSAFPATLQLLVLALRKRAEGAHARATVRNLLQVLFGLHSSERAVWAFEIVFRALAGAPAQAGAFERLQAEVVSVQELALLRVLVALQGRNELQERGIASVIGGATLGSPLWRALELLARLLPDRPAPYPGRWWWGRLSGSTAAKAAARPTPQV